MTWQIRPARPEDGPAIGKLYADEPDADRTLDWSDPGLAPWWLVAERDGDVIGAIQVVCARPVGLMSEIIVRANERHCGVGRTLYDAGEATMRAAGIQAIILIVAEPRQEWRRAIRGWGFAEFAPLAVTMRKGL